MALQCGKHIRLAPDEKARLKRLLAEQGYGLPIIHTTDDYLNATVLAATDDARDIITKALIQFQQRSKSGEDK